MRLLRHAVLAGALVAACSATLAAAASTAVVPRSGAWTMHVVRGGTGSGPSGRFQVTSASFTVSPRRSRVVRILFSYAYSGPATAGKTCSGTGAASTAQPRRIAKRRFSAPAPEFWTGGGSADVDGSFDSARHAHGTARFRVEVGGGGCKLSGLATAPHAVWRASR